MSYPQATPSGVLPETWPLAWLWPNPFNRSSSGPAAGADTRLVSRVQVVPSLPKSSLADGCALFGQERGSDDEPWLGRFSKASPNSIAYPNSQYAFAGYAETIHRTCGSWQAMFSA